MPTSHHLARLSQASKHQLGDPALAARLLNLSADGLVAGHGDTASIKHGGMLGA